ncbi:unnamed protein product [Brucella canis str. Oliveri]|nr:unnamed protein product [Brucella canis str. Oliveri]
MVCRCWASIHSGSKSSRAVFLCWPFISISYHQAHVAPDKSKEASHRCRNAATVTAIVLNNRFLLRLYKLLNSVPNIKTPDLHGRLYRHSINKKGRRSGQFDHRELNGGIQARLQLTTTM